MPGVVKAYVEESRNQKPINESRAFDAITGNVETGYRGEQRRVGEARRVLAPRAAELHAELLRSTNELLDRAGRRAVVDRAIERDENRQMREAYAAAGGPDGWVPGNPTSAQRQEWRDDHERRRGWNRLIEGGVANLEMRDRPAQDLKPPAGMTKPEIVAEARQLHAHFNELYQSFEAASGAERADLREQMKPLAVRENELRDEYFGRVKAELAPGQLTQDQVPEESFAYGR